MQEGDGVPCSARHYVADAASGAVVSAAVRTEYEDRTTTQRSWARGEWRPTDDVADQVVAHPSFDLEEKGSSQSR
jgi:hypothetical protein